MSLNIFYRHSLDQINFKSFLCGGCMTSSYPPYFWLAQFEYIIIINEIINEQLQYNFLIFFNFDFFYIFRFSFKRFNYFLQPFTVQQQNSDNDEGIILTTPCTGFTPGQKVPYHIKCKTSQPNCKILVQLNCQITAVGRSQTPCADPVAIKQAKQIINRRKHLPSEIMSYLNLPLDCQIARAAEGYEDSMLRYEYLLEAFLIDGCKKILANVSIPLTIGTTPCLKMNEEAFDDVMCYDNYGK